MLDELHPGGRGHRGQLLFRKTCEVIIEMVVIRANVDHHQGETEEHLQQVEDPKQMTADPIGSASLAQPQNDVGVVRSIDNIGPPPLLTSPHSPSDESEEFAGRYDEKIRWRAGG